MPIGAAVSTDVSASTGTTSNALSPQSGRSDHITQHEHILGVVGEATAGRSQVDNITEDRVITRGRVACVEPHTVPRGPRPRFEVGLLPRLSDRAVAANAQCFVLHPDHGDMIVAEGRTGGSWKSPKQKFGSLCAEGEQMDQIHKVIKSNLPLPFIEDRNPFTTLDQALVKPSGSSVYVKWHSRLLIPKPKPSTRPQ